MKIGPHELTRGQLVGSPEIATSSGQTSVNGDGGVSVAEGLYVEEFFRYKANLPRAEALRLKYYIQNNLRFQAETVTVIDGFGVSRVMRYWDKSIKVTPIGGDMVKVDWPFRTEVTP